MKLTHLKTPECPLCVCVCVVQQSYDILLLILMVLLLVQAILTSATVVHCASYKSQLRMGAVECDDSMHTSSHYCEVRQVEGRSRGHNWTHLSVFIRPASPARDVKMCRIRNVILFRL